MLKARHIMRRKVVTVHPDATMGDALDLLIQARISGLVVADRAGKPLGVISEYGLLAAAYDEGILDDPVSEHMTRDLICVEEGDSLRRIADLCVIHRVRRLPVVRGGKLVGLISRRDLLRGVRRASARRSRPKPPAPQQAETSSRLIEDL